MGPCLALLVQLMLIAATQHGAAEPIPPALLSDWPDNVTTTKFNGPEKKVTSDPSFEVMVVLFITSLRGD